MKKVYSIKEISIEEAVKEISIEEVVKDFYEEYCEDLDSEDFDSELDYYIKDKIKEISPEEREVLKEEIRKLILKQKEEVVAEEKYKLKDRESILEWISYYICDDDYLEKGNVGYYLSAKEILDLIIENGKK